MKSKNGLGNHSNNSFVEKDAIAILGLLLRSKRTIQTSFSEDDRWPNHDNFFELLDYSNDSNKPPKKMFIVQIKGTEGGIKKIKQGENTGQYSYNDFCTKLLFSVKQRVITSPAIYFVVDVKTKEIFWIHLSDEKLMELDFDNKPLKFTYYFSEEDKILDIDAFTAQLHKIADEQNKNQPYKSIQEIQESHKALFYINNTLDNDLGFIKSDMLPWLWRFGIRSANKDKMGFYHVDEKLPILHQTNKFELYPQKITRQESSIQNFSGIFGEPDGFFKRIDTTGSMNPQKYVESALSTILKDYFESPYIIRHLSEKVVCEILSNFVREFEFKVGFSFGGNQDNKSIHDTEIALYSIMKYINKLALEDEHLFRLFESYKNNPSTDRFAFDAMGLIQGKSLEKAFASFYKEYSVSNTAGYFCWEPCCEMRYYEYLFAILRARKLNMDSFTLIQEYPRDIIKSNNFGAIEKICESWFEDLLQEYPIAYTNIFRDNKYYNHGLFEYALAESSLQGIVWNIAVSRYEGSFNIIKNNLSYSEVEMWKSIDNGATKCNTVTDISVFIDSGMPLYYSIKCLLYQGIALGLDVKCDGIALGMGKHTIFG